MPTASSLWLSGDPLLRPQPRERAAGRRGGSPMRQDGLLIRSWHAAVFMRSTLRSSTRGRHANPHARQQRATVRGPTRGRSEGTVQCGPKGGRSASVGRFQRNRAAALGSRTPTYALREIPSSPLRSSPGTSVHVKEFVVLNGHGLRDYISGHEPGHGEDHMALQRLHGEPSPATTTIVVGDRSAVGATHCRCAVLIFEDRLHDAREGTNSTRCPISDSMIRKGPSRC